MQDLWKVFYQILSIIFRNDFIKLNVDITDADHAHGGRVCKECQIKHLGQYYDLYVESHTLLFTVLRTLEICDLKYTNLILQNFFQLLD